MAHDEPQIPNSVALGAAPPDLASDGRLDFLHPRHWELEDRFRSTIASALGVRPESVLALGAKICFSVTDDGQLVASPDDGSSGFGEFVQRHASRIQTDRHTATQIAAQPLPSSPATPQRRQIDQLAMEQMRLIGKNPLDADARFVSEHVGELVKRGYPRYMAEQFDALDGPTRIRVALQRDRILAELRADLGLEAKPRDAAIRTAKQSLGDAYFLDDPAMMPAERLREANRRDRERRGQAEPEPKRHRDVDLTGIDPGTLDGSSRLRQARQSDSARVAT